MNPTEKRLVHLLHHRDHVKVMIIGLGSVGTYLLDYLCSSGDPALEVVVAGRNMEKMESDVNIVRVASMIRGQNRTKVAIDNSCDLERVEAVAACIAKHQPDIIINSSRVRSGLKYGSISWRAFRAYGIWAPLAVKYTKTIMDAAELAGSQAIVINTSYSDAVIPWLKGAGCRYPDFGSGNLNHLIPRIQFAAGGILGFADPWNLDVTLATGHFHDVVISKEGHAESVEQLLDIRHQGKPLVFDQAEVLRRCKIPMPVDAKRNMMNASSNYQVISGLLRAVRNRERIKLHIPGALGELGGYPVIVDGSRDTPAVFVDEGVFSLQEMREKNRKSMALDGIEGIQGDELIYTDGLIEKVQAAFSARLPKRVSLGQAEQTADFLVERVILKAVQ